MYHSITLKYLALFVLVTGLFCSCRKESNSNSVKETANMICGTYNLKMIKWEGEPVDVNNDGVASNNLYQELMDLPTNAENKDNYTAQVFLYSEDMSKATISMMLPIQNYSISSDGRYPEVWMIGNPLPMHLSYSIDSKGSIQVERFESFNLPESDSRVELKRMKNGTISFDLNEHLTFRTEYTLYDRLTKQLVDGVIQYIYERVED